jgi:hypothetical protein
MSAPEQCILGLDPGISGALAFYFPAHPELIAVEDAPVAGGEIDAATLARRIAQMAPTIAVIAHPSCGKNVRSRARAEARGRALDPYRQKAESAFSTG